jgi:hypothetical protein
LAGLIRELGDWALELARQCYKPVADSEKIFSSASEALSLPIFYFSLQEAWIREPSADDSYKLTAFFLPYMRRRGMNFVTARRITEDMYDYWTERAKGKNIPADRFFLLNKDTFDRHIAVHRELFALDLPEAFKSLWGAGYVYDFLFSLQLIPQEQYEEALRNIRALKAKVFSLYSDRLWEAGFVCKACPSRKACRMKRMRRKRFFLRIVFAERGDEEGDGSANPARTEARKRKKKKKKKR